MNPYPDGEPQPSWKDVTDKLVHGHPLWQTDLLGAVLGTWVTLWQTTLGTGELSVGLKDIAVPATVVGYFFETLFAREMQRRHPGRWRGNSSKDEKDLVYVRDQNLSVEIKTSGQAGYRVFGNRSYGQEADNDLLVKKEKSGYYITVNFCGHDLTLVRFGWINASDWKPQAAQTGQMAGLAQYVYDYQLVALPGAYRRQAPVQLLNGIGAKTAERLRDLGIATVGDLLEFDGELPAKAIDALRTNEPFLDECVDRYID